MLHTKFRGNRTSIMLIDFHFLVPEIFIQNLVQNGTVFSEKIGFDFFVCTRPWAKVKK